MDQDAFRRLLATPRAGGSSSSSRPGAFKPRPKPSAGGSTSGGGLGEDEFKKPGFKPRSSKQSGPTPSGYVDRAAERRAGRANEYTEVEKLLADFVARTENVEDKAAVEEQMKYLVSIFPLRRPGDCFAELQFYREETRGTLC
jgi:IK cytokine